LGTALGVLGWTSAIALADGVGPVFITPDMGDA